MQWLGEVALASARLPGTLAYGHRQGSRGLRRVSNILCEANFRDLEDLSTEEISILLRLFERVRESVCTCARCAELARPENSPVRKQSGSPWLQTARTDGGPTDERVDD
jgi:hypothetical protein